MGHADFGGVSGCYGGLVICSDPLMRPDCARECGGHTGYKPRLRPSLLAVTRESDGPSAVDLVRMHLDNVVEHEQRQRHPDRRRRRGANFEHRHSDDAKREHDIQVDIVIRGEPNLPVERIEPIYDRARGIGMARQESTRNDTSPSPSMIANMTAEHGDRLIPARFAVECDGLATETL